MDVGFHLVHLSCTKVHCHERAVVFQVNFSPPPASTKVFALQLHLPFCGRYPTPHHTTHPTKCIVGGNITNINETNKQKCLPTFLPSFFYKYPPFLCVRLARKRRAGCTVLWKPLFHWGCVVHSKTHSLQSFCVVFKIGVQKKNVSVFFFFFLLLLSLRPQ